jgi:iron complex transport system ATP-binding protein
MLEIRNLWADYGGDAVLRGVSLDVAAGEVVGLVGPNGSGKTTLVRTVTRVMPASSGEVRLMGDDCRTLSRAALARRVAVVPQSPALPEGFAVLEIVLMGRTPHLRLLQSEGPPDLAAARRALAQTGTSGLAQRFAHQLSGGERQQVVIARALAQEAPVLLLDEPTSHLDVGHQAGVMGLVRRLCRERSLAVLATIHDLTLAALYCDRLVLLDRGAVVAEGAPESVLRPELIARTYGTEVTVLRHPASGRPVVVPSLGTAEQWNSGTGREARQPSAADAMPGARPSRPSDGGDGTREGEP